MTILNSTFNNSGCTGANCTMDQEYHSEMYYFSTYFKTTLACYFVCLIFGGILLNLILGYAIASEKKLRSISNIFILNLAICDFITASACVSFDADLFIRGYFPYGTFVCGIREVAFMMSLPGSVGCLFWLSMERFVTIMFPFKRRAIITKKTVTGMIIITWSYTLCVALFPIMYNPDAVIVYYGACFMMFPLIEYGLYQAVVNFLFPAICIIIVNVTLLKVATKHARIIRKQHINHRNKNRKLLPRVLANIKALKSIVFLVGVFVFCWLTFIIMVTANILCGVCHPREVTWIGNAINYSSVVLNPLVYGYSNRKIKKQIRRNFLKFYCTTFIKKRSNNILLKKFSSRSNFDNESNTAVSSMV